MKPDTKSLDGLWNVRPDSLASDGKAGLRRVRRARSGWMDARVPGEIHLDLMRAGKMPEPLESDNIAECRWPEDKSWWYRKRFRMPAQFLRHERQELIFDGLDLYAQVFLNGKPVGSAANAFVSATFDARPYLQAGDNELVVRMTAGSELARAKEPNYRRPTAREIPATGDFPPRKWLRKPQFAYGWDWIEPLPNVGITGPVRLEGRSHVALHELRLDTVLRGKKVFVEVDAVIENLHPWSERRCTLKLELQPPKGARGVSRSYKLDCPVGRSPVRDLIEVPGPQLWWPNGSGGQPLYKVVARVLHGRTECDRREFCIGLRTVEIDRSRLPGGSRFCIKVNGRDIFCKGANWGPADAILPRVSRQKYEQLVADAQDANFNMFRINGVGTIEPPAFFDACDRAGILVWQDFNFACTSYPDDDPEFRDEADSIVRSLRHHPSIALWCGCNENIWQFPDRRTSPNEPADTGGMILYNQILPDICRLLDPRRPYWPSSPLGGEDPNDELTGNCHWWQTAFMSPDMARRVRHEVYDDCRARFVSEFGCIGPCHPDSVRRYLAADERHPDHPTWQLHTNACEKETIAEAIRLHYADPGSLKLPEYSLYGQMFQATILGRAVEAMRFRTNDKRYECSGALIWSYSDCWGETGWSIIDYYCRRKAAYYWVRRACKPLKVIVRQRGRKLVTRVINDSPERVAGTVEHGWFRIDGDDRMVTSRRLTVPAGGMAEAGAERMPPARDLDPRAWVYGAVLRTDEHVQDQSVWPLLPHRQLSVPTPEIRVSRKGKRWEVCSPTYCHGVHCNDHGRAVLSDNYLDLLPGVPLTIARADGKRSLPALASILP
ncbi:MAG: hypothetical protein HQ592_01455 [Planctomycetes bacterium]|nr:hypothetical protein [Planctomycetota bacterium]